MRVSLPDVARWRKGTNASEAHAEIKNASSQEMFDYSLHRQGLLEQHYPINFKEIFSVGNYKYEARVHNIIPNAPLRSNSANGPTDRVDRNQSGVNIYIHQ